MFTLSYIFALILISLFVIPNQIRIRLRTCVLLKRKHLSYTSSVVWLRIWRGYAYYLFSTYNSILICLGPSFTLQSLDSIPTGIYVYVCTGNGYPSRYGLKRIKTATCVGWVRVGIFAYELKNSTTPES